MQQQQQQQQSPESPSEDSVDYWQEVDSIDYWEQVDRISEQYRHLTQQEERYIFEHEFELPNQIYKVVTGLSAARNYIPAVRLLLNTIQVNKTNHISFTIDEWTEFITYLKYLMSYFTADDDDDDMTTCFEIDYIKISSSMCMDMKMLEVSNGTHVYYLSELAAREIISVHERLIDAHLYTLHKLDFDNYYNTFLESANDILYKSNYDLNPENVLLNLCSDSVMLDSQLSSFSFIQLYCIRECLFYNRDKVLNDLDRKMYYQCV